MRLARDVPAVQEKILAGDLSLTNASKIQTATARVRKTKKVTPAEKTVLVEECLHLSQRECDLKLFAELPELKETPGLLEKSRSIDEEHIELKLIVGRKLQSKIDELQNLLSHTNPEKSCLKLLERLVDQELGRLKKRKTVSTVELKVPLVAQIKYNPTDSAAEQTPLKANSAPKKKLRAERHETTPAHSNRNPKSSMDSSPTSMSVSRLWITLLASNRAPKVGRPRRRKRSGKFGTALPYPQSAPGERSVWKKENE